MENLERLCVPSSAFSINRDSVASVPYFFEDFLLSILRRMKFAEDGCSMFDCLPWSSSDAFGSAFLNFSVWELCFSLVSPLWELCFSLAFG